VFHHIPKEDQTAFLVNLFNLFGPSSKLVAKDIDAAQWGWLIVSKLQDLLVAQELGHEITAEEFEATMCRIGFETDGIARKPLYAYAYFTIVCTKPGSSMSVLNAGIA
jgi:hypothetical protein